MRRREALGLLALAAAAPALRAAPAATLVEVWLSPTCGCCGDWVKHLQKSGFATRVQLVDDTARARAAAGIPERLGSCHTAKVDGYAIEGHVPADDIRRLLRERPRARGLAAPGMPAASPGMDVPRSPPYDVLLVRDDGSTSVFARHAGT